MNPFQRVLRLVIMITGMFQVLLGFIFWPVTPGNWSRSTWRSGSCSCSPS